MEDFQIYHKGNIVVVRVDLVAATLRDAQPLWNEFEEYSLFNYSNIIIDLSACAHVDSTFIGMIIKIFKRVIENNGQLNLVFPQLFSIEQLRVIGIKKIIDCYDNLEEAFEFLSLTMPTKKMVFKEMFHQN
jgi:anti-anti-sigma regulatory factor